MGAPHRLGTSDIQISPIVMGMWQAGKEMWTGIDDTEIRRAVHAAVEAGINAFDTAEMYGKGHSERMLAAATADIRDFNLIDPFHLEAYNQQAINYNRDVEAFPLLARIIERITGAESFYRSPTDMGVNRAGFAIVDDAVGGHDTVCGVMDDATLRRGKPTLPRKICVACGRPFAWRKKWERCWEQVRYCSDRCRTRGAA